MGYFRCPKIWRNHSSVKLIFVSLVFGLFYITVAQYLGYLWLEVSYPFMVLLGVGFISFIFRMFLPHEPPLERGPMLNNILSFSYLCIVWCISLLLSYVIALFFIRISLCNPFIIYRVAFFVGSVPFLMLFYGILFGKYNYKLEEVELGFQHLPDSFDGYRFIQISDIHAGSLDSLRGVQKAIDLIAAQDVDAIFFTGDLVNRYKDEINPFIKLFSTLQPRDGKFAVLGNHDYYGQPREKADRKSYYNDFFKKYQLMGFDLLLNENRRIYRNGKYINIAGVENWGLGSYFPKRGDLDLAIRGMNKANFTILLSHDPTHWIQKIQTHPFEFSLTLSGHTHGMQFGILLPFFKWSPIQYRYKHWLGLYSKGGKYLYVNRGLGMLGYLGRVGMTAEITVFTLRHDP